MKLSGWFLLVLLSGGCSVPRKTTTDNSLRRTDSVVRTMRDSLALSRRLQASTEQLLRLRHFTFSPPDSAGRQYVESVTALSAVTGETRTEQAAAERKQATGLTEERTEESAGHTATAAATRAGRFPCGITGIAIAVMALYALYGKRK